MNYQGVEVKSLVDLVGLVENVLGWAPDRRYHPAKARGIQAGLLRRKVEAEPERINLGNLLLALDYCRRKKIHIKSPSGLVWFIDRAVEEAGAQLPENAAELAIEAEVSQQRPGWQSWVMRLDRARGPAMTEVLLDWQRTRAPA